MYEKQFLNDVATQNYTKYNIDVKTVESKLAHKLLEKTAESMCNISRKSSEDKRNWIDRLAAFPENGKMFVVNKRFPNDIIQTATATLSGIWFRDPFLDSGLRTHLPLYETLDKGN